MNIRNTVAIVTGASGGIGKATALALSEKGAAVVLASRNKNKLSALAREIPQVFVVPADMTKSEDIRALVKRTISRFGRVDILINNAGQGYDAPVEFISVNTFKNIFELDVVGPLRAMQLVIPVMRKAGGGSIVNISSGTALMYLPNMAGYSSLKRALAGLSLTAREELKKDHINVSVVYPYVTNTDFETNTLKDHVPEWEGSDLPHPPDSPEYIAGKIVAGIERGEAEIFAHHWMK